MQVQCVKIRSKIFEYYDELLVHCQSFYDRYYGVQSRFPYTYSSFSTSFPVYKDPTHPNPSLSTKAQSVSCTGLDSSSSTCNGSGGVSVRNSVQAAASESCFSTTKIVALRHSSSGVVNRVQRLLRAGEDIVLYQRLGTLPNIDHIVDRFEHVIEDVGCAEAQGRSTGTDILPVVVDVRDLSSK